MKILHITYYGSPNPGTFLQAYGVEAGLKKVFPQAKIDLLNAEFVKRNPKAKKNTLGWYHLLKTKYLSYRRIRMSKSLINEYFTLTKERINVFDYDPSTINQLFSGYDLIVIGSDTILEKISYPQFNKIGLMWGIDGTNVPKVLYAASGDDCIDNKRNTVFHSLLKTSLEQFKFIGVRDGIIQSFIVDDLGINRDRVTKQPDPTYNLSLDLFELSDSNKRKLQKLKGKIALFHIDRRCLYRSKLAQILKSKGYRLITPEYDPNCDISFGYIDHFQWAALFKYVDVVITERFHETVFALRNTKSIVNVDWNKSKINDEGDSKRTEILKEYGLNNCNIKIINNDDLDKFSSFVDSSFNSFNPSSIELKNRDLIKLTQDLLNVMAKKSLT